MCISFPGVLIVGLLNIILSWNGVTARNLLMYSDVLCTNNLVVRARVCVSVIVHCIFISDAV